MGEKEFNKALQLVKLKRAVLKYAEDKGYHNAKFVITFDYTILYGNVYPSCSFLLSNQEKRTLAKANNTDYYLIKNDDSVALLKVKNIAQALDYAFEANFSKSQHPKDLKVKHDEHFDPVEDAMEYAVLGAKIKPFFYSQRNKLANLFKKWAKDNELAVCPTNLITWLSSNDLLDMNKVFELLNKEK